MCLTVDANKHLIKVPAPIRPIAAVDAPPPYFTGKHRTETVPTETHCLVTDVDAAFEQDVFDLAQRHRIEDLHHHCDAEDLGRAVEVTKGIAHRCGLRELAFRFKPVFFDSALWRAPPGRGHLRSDDIFRLEPSTSRQSRIPQGAGIDYDASSAASRADSLIAVHSEAIMSTTAAILEKS